MRSFWLDPYLWVHLAGVAVVPIALEGCLMGFAASNSLLPPWMELGLVGAIGALPILWMQWQRPFCIYSLMFLAVQPRQLSDNQRRILRRFKQPIGKGLSVLAAVLLLVVLWQLYQLAPIAWEASAIVPGGVLGGLVLAAVSFLISNLFLQVPVSVAQVMLTDEQTIAATEPYPVNAIGRDFTLFGIQINQQILPQIRAAVPATAAAGVAGSAMGTSKKTVGRSSDRLQEKSQERFQEKLQEKPQEQSQEKAKPRYRDPLPVIDAEFRELGTEDEWDEVIVSEEESLTETAPLDAVAPITAPLQVQAELETQTESGVAGSPETQVDSELLPESSIDSALHTNSTPEADLQISAENTGEVAEPVIPAENSETIASEPIQEELLLEEELLEPIPEPIEEQPGVEINLMTAGNGLQISSITLMETEDVSEDAAVDLPAVEVVTAEIVEDVSEDAALPTETIESWLEDDDWQDETAG